MSCLQHNPLLSLMRFHEDFLLRCDIDQCRAHLSEFELSMDKVSADDDYKNDNLILFSLSSCSVL